MGATAGGAELSATATAHQKPLHPAQRGRSRSIPRGLFAYSGRHKFEMLVTIVVMMMKGALQDCDAQSSNWTRDVTQEELALSSGVNSRSTFTRRLGLFARTLMWTALQRSQQSRRMKRMRAAHGRPVRVRRSSTWKPWEMVHSVVHARRRFAMPNSYNCRLPIKHNKDLPSSLDFLEAEEWSRMFDPRCAPENGFREAPTSILDQFPNGKGEYRGFNGVKQIPTWAWSHKVEDMPGWMSERQKRAAADLDDKDRLVLTFYFMCGILDHKRNELDETAHARPAGMVNVGQEKVAWCCGISVKSVYRANARLAAAELIRVTHPDPEIRQRADGTMKYTRGPQRILYLPVRRYTPEEAQAEADRFSIALRLAENSVEHARDRAYFRQALELHATLLREWTGKEHAPTAIRNELRRRLLALGMRRKTVRILLPRPPD